MSETRTQLNIKIDPKTHWMAKLAARHNGVSLEDFVETALVKSITRKAMRGDEPNVKEPTEPQRLWLDDLWSEDEAGRVFNIATAKSNLLSTSEKQIWTFYLAHMKVTKNKLGIQSFRAFWQQLKGTK